MAASERVVVLVTPEQKKLLTKRARAENLSLSDYMRRRALGDDELLAGLLSELRASTAQAVRALDGVIARLQESESREAALEAEARERALAEFADVDPELLAELFSSGHRAPDAATRKPRRSS